MAHFQVVTSPFLSAFLEPGYLHLRGTKAALLLHGAALRISSPCFHFADLQALRVSRHFIAPAASGRTADP